MRRAFHLRPAASSDVSALAHIHVVGWQTTYRDILSDTFLDGLREVDRLEQWRRNVHLAEHDHRHLLSVAENEASEPVAFVSAGPARQADLGFPGELYAIYILPRWRRQGIGRCLVALTAKHLIAHQMPAMVLWVATANPACRFYEALGGAVIAERSDMVGGSDLDEVAYGWRDLASLAVMEE
jgi:ribosomal protein S18 acetylase RimI-like enzyme